MSHPFAAHASRRFIAEKASSVTRSPRPRVSIPAALRLLPLALATALTAAPLAAHAQTAPTQLPPGAEPGREAPRPVLPQSTRAAPPVAVPRALASEAPPGARDTRFVLNELVVDGATAYPAESLRGLYAALLGREVSVAEVFAAAQAIELRYRNDGFVTTRVIVPQQTVEDGRFRIVVVEGHIAQLVYQGEVGAARAAVETLLQPLRGQRPVNIAEIERRLLLANDLPGFTVQGTLEASPTEPGGSILIVRAERRPRDVSLTLDTRASPYLDSRQLTAQAAWYGLGERAERFGINARTSGPGGRSASVGLNLDVLVTAQGGTLSLGASHARSRPGRELDVLDVQSRVDNLSGTWAQPVIRSREHNLRAVAQLEMRRVSTDLAGTAFTRDRLDVLRAGLSWDRADRFDGISTARVMLHQGLTGLGSSEPPAALASRVNGRRDFSKLTLDLTRLQQLGPRSHLLASLTAQISRHALLASEELSLGGASYGRAFDDGEVAGDNGYAVMVELRHQPAFLPRQGQVYGFADAGKVWAAEGGAVPARPKLASLGGGLRVQLSGSLMATLEVAKPLNTEVRTRGTRSPRAFVAINAAF